jgi:hypothetical protein
MLTVVDSMCAAMSAKIRAAADDPLIAIGSPTSPP